MADDGVEFQGKTVEDAIVQAERTLGVQRGELDIDVVTPGRAGVFGIGAESARITARRREAVAASVADTASSSADVVEAATVRPESRHAALIEDEDTEVGGEESEGQFSEDEPPAGSDLPAEAAEVLSRLLHSMGFDAQVAIRSTQAPIMLAITGNNLGVLIGRRGDNLSSLQFMVNLILSKNRRQWPKVVIDVENYRARREESLRTLAERIAYRVRRNGRPFTLEAMPAGDRRAIHLALRDELEVETYSIGEGVSRRVVVAPRRGGEGTQVPSHYEDDDDSS